MPKERIKIKDEVFCGECNALLEPAEYEERFTCDSCGADFYDRDATPLGCLYMDIESPREGGHTARRIDRKYFDKPECMADFVKGLKHDSYSFSFPWMSRHMWRLYATRLIEGDDE